MPIIGTYTWTEKKDLIKVIVPLKGTSPNKVDILVTSKTLKVNFSPYIVDIVLHSTIDAIKHKATVKEGNLQITLYKTDNSLGLWGILERKDDKTVLTKLREDSITAHEVAEKELEEKRKDRRTDDERYSLKKQMGLEESERNRLDDLKQEEKRSAEEEVYETFSKMQSEKERSNQKLEIIEGNQLKVKKAEAKEVIIDTFPTPITPVIPKEPIDYATFLKRKEAKALETLSTNSKDIFDTTSLPIVNIDEETFDDDDTDYVDAKKNGRKQDNDAMVTKFDAEIPIVRIDEEIDEEIDDVRYIPPPRTVGQSDIQFTPRVFPTPMRESKIAEEDDWIAKNRRHLKKHGVLGKNAKNGVGGDASEEDPVWLKAKGDDFYRGGDFRSALNAYSAAIDMNENMTACYSNRSNCYLRLEMYSECRYDCIEVVKQIDEELASISKTYSSANAVSEVVYNEMKSLKTMLAKILLRSGTSNCQLGVFTEALNDYTRANNLLFGFNNKNNKNDKTNEMNAIEGQEIELPGITKIILSNDLNKISKLLQVDILKKEGDSFFAESELLESITKYDEALMLIPVHVGCLSNRSACKLALKDLQGCIDDCSNALSLLSVNGNTNYNEINMLNSILPPIGSDKRKTWVIKTILRRGAAYVQLSQNNQNKGESDNELHSIDLAVEDYRIASSLDIKNDTLKSDLNKIINYREGRKNGSI